MLADKYTTEKTFMINCHATIKILMVSAIIILSLNSEHLWASEEICIETGVKSRLVRIESVTNIGKNLLYIKQKQKVPEEIMILRQDIHELREQLTGLRKVLIHSEKMKNEDEWVDAYKMNPNVKHNNALPQHPLHHPELSTSPKVSELIMDNSLLNLTSIYRQKNLEEVLKNKLNQSQVSRVLSFAKHFREVQDKAEKIFEDPSSATLLQIDQLIKLLEPKPKARQETRIKMNSKAMKSSFTVRMKHSK